MLIYWINIAFQFREHLIKFTFLNIEYIGRQLMLELMKILKFFKIKDKLLGVIIDNASNNGILKDELERALNRREFQ